MTTYEMRLRLINPWFPYSCYVFINFLLYSSLLLCIWMWNVLVCVSPYESISPGIESCGYEVLASKEFLRNILSSLNSVSISCQEIVSSLLSTLKQHHIFEMPLRILWFRLLNGAVLLAKEPLEVGEAIQ